MRPRIPLSEFKNDALTVAEVASVLGVGEKAVRKAAKEGLLPANYIGRRLIFCKERLRRWMAGQQAGK